jgi:hypothetical protein
MFSGKFSSKGRPFGKGVPKPKDGWGQFQKFKRLKNPLDVRFTPITEIGTSPRYQLRRDNSGNFAFQTNPILFNRAFRSADISFLFLRCSFLFLRCVETHQPSL